MIEFFRRLFDTDFMPHIMCLRTPLVIWLHAVSDGLIAVAYFVIPLGLVRIIRRRRDLAYHWMFILFATFILSCGATHLLSIVTLWVPIYRFTAVINVITAAASLLTAVLLIRLIPAIATLPSPEQWRIANEELKGEINQRRSAEAAMLSLNADLERRVEQRTRELERQNLKLQELTTAWDLAHGLIRDPEGRITFWCEGNEDLYGWKKQEATGRLSSELLAAEYPTPFTEIQAELYEKGSWTGQLSHTTKSGARIQVAAHWTLQRDTAGAPSSVIEVNNDITDRLRADEASKRLAELVESSSDAIIGSTPEGRITSWNSSAEALFGYSAAEMIGNPIDPIIPAERREDERTTAARVVQGTGASRYEGTRVSKTGRQMDVSLTVSPIRNSRGEVIGTSQIVRDISEAKAREEAFRNSEERQRLAVEAGQVGLWYLDFRTRKSVWTPRCKELHGLSVEAEVPDYPDSLLFVHADDRESLKRSIENAINGRSELLAEYRTRGLDFQPKWIQTRGCAQRSSDGTVIGFHGTVIDLTARRKMEEQLRRANAELEHFAYAAAHDLQEPIRNVALAAGLLKRATETAPIAPASPSDDAAPRLLSNVVDNARRMESMVKDLLAYSRSLEEGSDQPAASDADQVARKAMQNLSAAISEGKAEITFDKLPWVSMQETHLLQILQNLIANALKYAGSNQPRIHIGAKARNEDVLLFVKDNGVGIAPQFHQRAFRMFKRLHDGPIKGSGIGLAVCKRIVEHYGGQIWVESEAGEGATFFFTVPSMAIVE